MQRRLSSKDRPIIPAILSLGGTILPFFILGLLIYNVLNQPPLGLDVPIWYAIFVFGIVILTLIAPILFSLLLFYRPANHMIWGTVLTGWHSAITTLVIIFVSELASHGGMFDSSWIEAVFFTPLLGIAGGVLGIFWKPNLAHNT